MLPKKNHETEQNDNFANEVLPSFEIEENPVLYSVKRNDMYYIVAFGKVLTPEHFNSLDDVQTYVSIHQSCLIQLAMLAHWASSHSNEIYDNSKNV